MQPTEPGTFWGQGVGGREFPSGAADVFGNGPYDIFLGLDRVYPFEEFNEDGAPVYGQSIAVPNGGGTGRLILGTGSDIYGLFWSGKQLTVRRLEKDPLGFTGGSSRTLTLPGNVVCAAGVLRPDGILAVAMTISNGERYLPPTPPDTDSPAYRPYDGQQRWRGGKPSYTLYTALFSSVALGAPRYLAPAFEGEGVFFFSQPSLTFLQPPNPTSDSTYLVGTEKGAALRLFTIGADGAVSEKKQMATGADGNGLIHCTISPNAVSTPNLVDEWGSLFVGDTGLLWYYPFTGQTLNSLPVFGNPLLVRLQGGEHRLGDLPVISAGDLDGDGLVDILGGNDGGHVFWLKNIGEEVLPEFDIPRFLDIDGARLIVRPGPVKSLQGPTESAWGYTCPTLYDWNLDGLPDIILNSSLGEVEVLFQREQQEGAPPSFEKPEAIYCDGRPLAITWRQQIAATDWGIPGNDQLVTFDEWDQGRIYKRLDSRHVEMGEHLKMSSGETILANTKFSGQFGRTKLQVVDWDGDSRYDLLFGVRRWHSIPNPVTGLPQSVGDDRQAGALLMRNVGTNADPVFEFPTPFQHQGSLIELGIHSASPSAVDLGSGSLDLLIAEETGSILYYSREELTP